jgi:3-dehydroquinate synthase
VTFQNESIDKKFSVSWIHRLRFTDDAFAKSDAVETILDELKPPKLLVVLDKGISDTNNPFMQSLQTWLDQQTIPVFEPVIVQGGEVAKNNMEVVTSIFGAVDTFGICRKSCILVIGGGAVLDATGYASSVAHRGIPLIRMPSTTLSQCDSGVGVKNGINYFGKKNFIGVFDPPFAVVNDSRLLRSLSNRHWRSGLSEVIKVAIVKDVDLFETVEKSADKLIERDEEVMKHVIKQSAILHLEHITNGGDPFERLDARPLDFGHWAAHKLEQITNNELSHGEAVSIGLAIDLRCSMALGLLKDSTADRIIQLLQKLGLPTSHPSIIDDALLDGIEEFRQHLGGRLTLLMLEDIAKSVNVHTLETSIVRQAIGELM